MTKSDDGYVITLKVVPDAGTKLSLNTDGSTLDGAAVAAK